MGYEQVQHWTDELAARLTSAGYEEVARPLDSDHAGLRAFRRSEFRFSWVMTRLHTIVVVQAVPEASAGVLDDFLRACVPWAKANKGGAPVGFQTGLAVMPVTVTELAHDDAINAATQRPAKMWAIIPVPVVVDVRAQRAYTPSVSMVWGAVYQNYLGQQQELVLAGTGTPTLRSAPLTAMGRPVVGALFSVSMLLVLVGAVVYLVSLFAG